MKKNKKFFLTSLLIICVIIFGAGIGYLYRLNEVTQVDALGTKDLEIRKSSFDNNPNIDDCFFLIDKFNLLEDYNNAIYYGKLCIDLGVKNSPRGWIVYFWMSDIYNKTNRFDLACKHLEVALTLDEKNIIREKKWIEKSGLEAVLDSILVEKRRSPKK